MGRSIAVGAPVDGGGAHGARRPRLLPGKTAPRIQWVFRHETTDPAIFREMGEPGLLGPTIQNFNLFDLNLPLLVVGHA